MHDADRQRTWLSALLGLGLILLGVRLRAPFAGFPLVLAGVWLAARASTRLIRLHARGRQDAQDELAGASLARRVFWLLLAVAEIDGRAEAFERELVRRFLLERFVDPVTAAELRGFEAQRLDPSRLAALAASLRFELSAAERATLFFWCCLITLTDRQFSPLEHDALQRVAKGLRIDAHHARALFHHAKARVLDGSFADGFGERSQSGTWRAPPGARARALHVLGLEEGASREQIRKRWRELVKRYHPDQHAHLGAVAAQEADQRFREVQAAYEALSAAG